MSLTTLCIDRREQCTPLTPQVHPSPASQPILWIAPYLWSDWCSDHSFLTLRSRFFWCQGEWWPTAFSLGSLRAEATLKNPGKKLFRDWKNQTLFCYSLAIMISYIWLYRGVGHHFILVWHPLLPTYAHVPISQ